MTSLQRFEDDLADTLRAAAPSIVAEHAAGRPMRRRRRRFALRWPAMAAATAGVVAAALLLSPERPSPRPALAGAATLLRQAAATAQATTPVRGYAYSRWTFRSTVGTAERHSGTQEQWIDARGRGQRVVRGGGRPPGTSRLSGDLPVGRDEIAVSELSRIAADPIRLDHLIDTQARQVTGFPDGQARAFATYRLLEQVLIADAPAGARAALLRRLATVPGLRRAGSTVTMTIGDIRFTLLLHDTTVIGTERRLLRRSSQAPGPPRVLDAWRLTASATVAEVGERP